MLKSELQFIGMINSTYMFIDKSSKHIKFSKCRKDLIDEFKLNAADSNGKWFNISYFQTVPPKSKDGLDEKINIISDMKLISF